MLKLTTASLLAASFVLPAMAQNTPSTVNEPATHSATTAMTTNPTATNYDKPSDRNSVMTDNGGMRTSKIVGSSVYNEQDQKVGSIDDLVIDKDHSIKAVLSVGGFLGIDSKLVEVPFDKLQFGDTKQNSDSRVVLPGMTKNSLNSMPEYKFTARS